MRRLVDQVAAAVDLDVVAQALQQRVVHTAFDVRVVADLAVGDDDLGERVAEPVDEAVLAGGDLIDVDVVAVLRRDIGQPLRAERELGVEADVAVADHFQHLGLVGDHPHVGHRELPAQVPVGGAFAVSELVVEDAVGAVLAGAVGPFEQHLAPDRRAGVGHDERAGVVVGQERALTREAVLFEELGARVVAVADLLAPAALVELALAVDQLAVEIEQHLAAVLLVVGDGLFPACVAALRGIGVVVGIAVVHARLPPSEGEDGVGPDALADILDAARQVGVLEQQFAVLVAEDDPLPAAHLLDPHRRVAVVPPRVGPAAVVLRGLVPRTRVGGYDVGVARPRFAGEAVRELVESRFQPREFAFGVGVEAQAVPRVLERRVVAAEIDSLAVAHVGEAVRGHAAARAARDGAHGVFGVHLAELLRRGLVGRGVAVAENHAFGIVVQLASGVGEQQLVVFGKRHAAHQRVVQFADDRVGLAVLDLRRETHLVAFERDVEREAHVELHGFAGGEVGGVQAVVGQCQRVAPARDAGRLLPGQHLDLLGLLRVVVEAPEIVAAGVVPAGFEVPDAGQAAPVVDRDLQFVISERVLFRSCPGGREQQDARACEQQFHHFVHVSLRVVAAPAPDAPRRAPGGSGFVS